MTMLTVKRKPNGIPTMMHLFDLANNFATPYAAPKGSFTPAVNVSETEKAFIMEFAVPGFEKSHFSVHMDKETLIISAKKETTQETVEKNYTRKEFSFGSFERRFTIPEHVDTDNIQASYTNGILHVELPKKTSPDVEVKKQIEIK